MRVFRPCDLLGDLSQRSIFLAGPTPRSETVPSWRPAAVKLLEEWGFGGDVLAPEPFVGIFDDQVSWEFHALENCGRICFWVPRDMEHLPGFTTNVEFGRYVASERILYGRPSGAPKTRYLDWMYTRLTDRQPYEHLDEMLKEAISECGQL